MTTEELILNNKGLIFKAIKDLKCHWKTEDEFQNYYDAGLLGLIKGAKTYDGSSTPGTYLYACIKNMIIREFYMSEQSPRKINKEIMISLNEKVNEESNETYLDFVEDIEANVEKIIFKKFEIERIKKAIDDLKNEQEKSIFCDFYGLKGHKRISGKEIEKKYNISHTTVSSRLKSARKKIKIKLGEVSLFE